MERKKYDEATEIIKKIASLREMKNNADFIAEQMGGYKSEYINANMLDFLNKNMMGMWQHDALKIILRDAFVNVSEYLNQQIEVEEEEFNNL